MPDNHHQCRCRLHGFLFHKPCAKPTKWGNYYCEECHAAGHPQKEHPEMPYWKAKS